MDEKPNVKMVSAEKVETLKNSTPKKPTIKEKQFIDEFVETGNATHAALMAFDCETKRSANTIGSRLVKKFGLEKYRVKKDSVVPQSIDRDNTKDSYLDSLDKAFSTNKITFEEMYNDVYVLAKHHKDAQVRLRAYDWLHEKGQEYEEKVLAREMETKDVVHLLAEALSNVDKQVYIDILKETRKHRTEKIRKRNTKVDAWELINKTRSIEKDTSNIVNIQDM